MTVKHDATTLSVERQGQNGPTTTAYVLDGKPNKMVEDGARGRQTPGETEVPGTCNPGSILSTGLQTAAPILRGSNSYATCNSNVGRGGHGAPHEHQRLRAGSESEW